MNEDTRRVEVRPEGVFIIGSKKLSLQCLKARKTRLEGEILDLQDDQIRLKNRIVRNSRKLQDLEQELATFNAPDTLVWMKQRAQELARKRKQQHEAKRIANQRAKAFLKDYIGDEAYQQLMKQGSLRFTGKDSRTYEIDAKGRLFHGSTKLCLIHPRNLPLPDFIAAILTTIKHEGYSRR